MCGLIQLMVDTVLFCTPSEYSVPLERISETQLILCHPERELLPLVLAHCQYTLKKGGETDSRYNMPGIQNQLARRFLAGKPLIQAVKPQTNHMHMSSKRACSADQHRCSLWSKPGHLEVPEQTSAGLLRGVSRGQRQDSSGKTFHCGLVQYWNLHLQLTNTSPRMFTAVPV